MRLPSFHLLPLTLSDLHQLKGQSVFIEFAVRVVNHRDPHRTLRTSLQISFPVKGGQGWGDNKVSSSPSGALLPLNSSQAFPTAQLTEEAGFIMGGKLLVDAELYVKRITFHV